MATVMTQAQLDLLKTTLVARWNAGLAMTAPDWMKIAKRVPSSGKSNTYEWLSQFPAFREWVGARLHKVFKENGYNVPNRKFETTVDVKREDWEDDNIGQYGLLAEGAGQSASDLMNDLVFQLIGLGFTTTCYDGQFYFDTDHPTYANEDGTGAVTNVSNVQAGAGAPWVLLCTKRAAAPLYLQERVKPQFDSITSPNSSGVFENDLYSFGGRWRGEAAFGFWQCAFGSKAALDAANFTAAYTAMMMVKGDGQRKLGIVPDTLLVGPDNLSAAETLLKAQQNANGSSNTNFNKVNLVVTPWL